MQPFIPSIDGYQSFVSKKQALTAAKLVIKKIKNNENPTLAIEEIRTFGYPLMNR